MDKTCKKCGETKDITKFCKHKTCVDGHEYTCKECAKKATALRKQQNPDYDKIKSREYRAAHLEELREKERLYYWRNVERKRIYRAQYYERNRDYLIQYSKNDYVQHPERWRYYGEKRRFRMNGGSLRPDDFRRICSEYGNKCLSCGSTEHLSMDHIVPLVKGGVHSPENIQPLCKTCNSRKYTQTIDYRPYVPTWIIGSIKKEEGNEITI